MKNIIFFSCLCFFQFTLLKHNTLNSQTPCDLPPCAQLDGPVFPGGSTLCDIYDDLSFDYTISDGTWASNLHLTLWPYSSTVFNNKEILIQGVFYIDIPTAFVNCTVKLSPGAQIIVAKKQSGDTELLSFRSKFFSCSEMWKGIIMSDDTKCRIYSSHIEDAEYALTIGQDVSLAIFSTKFNRNFISITNAEENHALPFLLFAKNTFDCTSELSEFNSLPYMNIDMVSFAGIYLNNCSSSIGYFEAGNVFKNLNYGIAVGNYSTANIKGCRFEDAQGTTTIPSILQDIPEQGCGVFGINSSLFIVGDSENESCQFKKAHVNVVSSNLELSFADFEDCGVTAIDGLNGETILIEDNYFYGEEYLGITAERSAASGGEIHTQIVRNVIEWAPNENNANLAAIYLVGTNNPTDIALVSDNTISYSKTCGHTGILHTVANSENARIEDNVIYFNISTSDWIGHGIRNWLAGSVAKGTKVSFNNITAVQYETGDPTMAILTNHVRGIEFCSNITNDFTRGLSFTGNCDNSFITQNDINQHGIGLLVENQSGLGGVIGTQERTGNEWLANSSLYEVDAARYISTADILFSQFLIAPEDISDQSKNPSNVTPSTGWFIEGGTQDNHCILEPNPPITSHDSLIINNDNAFKNQSEVIKFVDLKGLVSLIIDEELEGDYSGFLSTVEDSNAYKLGAIEIALKNAFQLDLDDQADLDSMLESMSSSKGEIVPYDIYNYTNVDTVSFTEGNGLDSIIYFLESCHNFAELQNSLASSNTADLEDDLLDILDTLGSIVPQQLFDEAYKTVYSLWIQKLVNGSLSAEEDSLILSIAQNESDSSLANLLAYELFRPCSGEGFPNYFIVPGIDDVSIDGDPIEKQRADMRRINDSSNFIPVEDSYYYEIFDLSGRIVRSGHLGDKFGDVDFRQDLQDGLYIYRARSVNGKSEYFTHLIPIFK